MRTNDLRKLIKRELDKVVTSYYRSAPVDAMYPHAVFSFRTVYLGDFSRDDYSLDVDIWCRRNPAQAEDIADSICDAFNFLNAPQDTILPTFFREARINVEDEDKDLDRITLRFSIQNYERG